MALSISNRKIVALVAVLACLLAGGYALMNATPSSALPAYAAATNQPCATCHVNPAGGGARNTFGQKFEAIPTHSTDPAGAFAIASGAAPAPPPPPPPAPSSALTVNLSGVATDDSVVYSIAVRNTTTSTISNLYVSGFIPSGTSFTAASAAPAGSSFFGSTGGVAAWLVNSVPGSGVAGPFVFKVAKGSATDLSSAGFAHWLMPMEGTANSAIVTPISNNERMAIDQAINDKFNNSDNTLLLWGQQPGSGPRMVEFARDINLAWFAAQAKNWEMALYELDDQFPSDINHLRVRNATLAPGLTNFQTTALKTAVDAVKAQDLNAFNTAFDGMTAACNSCHGGRPDSKSIKIIRPTASVIPELDFNGN
jgi:uncharacterized repeat protein (TIGR01451 family)